MKNLIIFLALTASSLAFSATAVDQLLVSSSKNLTGFVSTQESDIDLSIVNSTLPTDELIEIHLFLKVTTTEGISAPISVQIVDKLATERGNYKPLIWHSIRPENINNGSSVVTINAALENGQPDLSLRIATAGSTLDDNINIRYRVVATRLL